MAIPPPNKQRVLVVDDNPDIRGFIEVLLEGAGYEVACAGDGDEALGLLRERGADIVITDLFMPERDGLETIQALKRHFPGIGVVAISGDRRTAGEVDYLSVAEVAGADCVLRKPFSSQALFEAVRSAAARGSSSQ